MEVWGLDLNKGQQLRARLNAVISRIFIHCRRFLVRLDGCAPCTFQSIFSFNIVTFQLRAAAAYIQKVSVRSHICPVLLSTGQAPVLPSVARYSAITSRLRASFL